MTEMREPVILEAVRTPFGKAGGAFREVRPDVLLARTLDGLLERLAAQRIEHEPIETYSNGVRHVNVPDPDGNMIAFAEPPDA